MSEPYIGQITIFSFNYAPKGWAQCNGQLMPINQNQALFSILGTMYGGNGQTNFALPDFRGRVPVHIKSDYTQGTVGGEAAHILSIPEMPSHTHPVYGSDDSAASKTPANNLWAKTAVSSYHSTPDSTLSPQAVQPFGGSQPHNNMQPYLTLNFCIALVGIFPSRN